MRPLLIATVAASVFYLAVAAALAPLRVDAPCPAAGQTRPQRADKAVLRPLKACEAVPGFVSRGCLVAATRNAPTTYYVGRNGPMGFEHDLFMDFARYAGVKAELVVFDNTRQALEAVEDGRADIACAAVMRSDSLEKRFGFGPGYLTVQQQLVCRRFASIPRNVEDLAEMNIMVPEASIHDARLAELAALHPGLRWRTTTEFSTEQLLEKVWRGEIDCTVAVSNVMAINRRYYPELMVAFPVSETRPLAWAVRPDEEELLGLIHQFFIDYENSGRMARLRERYYGHVDVFDYVDIATFHHRISQRLPLLRPLFEQAAEKYGLDWKLLAAQAYQESHWDENAQSPTGVRGVMMLTEAAARDLDIEDRTDPRQSVMGGACYLSHMLERIPDSVRDPEDRMRLALAAYNVGMGHLWDARRLARRLGENPDTWKGVKTVLPLLRQHKYYKDLPYGYARGMEPVLYVRRVYDYRDILDQRLQSLEMLASQKSGPGMKSLNPQPAP